MTVKIYKHVILTSMFMVPCCKQQKRHHHLAGKLWSPVRLKPSSKVTTAENDPVFLVLMDSLQAFLWAFFPSFFHLFSIFFLQTCFTSVTRFAIYKPCWDSVDWTEPGIGAQYKDAGISGTIAQVWPKTSQVLEETLSTFMIFYVLCIFLWICEGSQTGWKLCLVMH